jgi:hypothetical protein
MGALTVTVSDRGVMGNKRWVRGTIDFSTSYATGGDTGLTATALGMDSIEHMDISQQADYTLEYVYASGNVLAFYGDYSEASDGAFVQVPNTTDVSTPLASIRFMTWGI